jgi:DNA-binding transcriptional LysR family regulator
MKPMVVFCAAVLVALTGTFTAAAQEITVTAPENTVTAQDREEAVLLGQGALVTEELLRKLAACDRCTKEQAAYLLGESKCTKAVIPLMSMLRNGEESGRVVAALALCRIGDARGTFAVKRAATFDESAKVRRLCAWYYDQYVEMGSFAFFAAEPPSPMLIGSR